MFRATKNATIPTCGVCCTLIVKFPPVMFGISRRSSSKLVVGEVADWSVPGKSLTTSQGRGDEGGSWGARVPPFVSIF